MPLDFKAEKIEALKAIYTSLTSPTGQEMQHVYDIQRALSGRVPIPYLKKVLQFLVEEELLARKIEENGIESFSIEEEGILLAEQRLFAELAPETIVSVPASDRLVSVNHNQEPVSLIVETLETIETELLTSNSVTELFSEEEKTTALAEVGALRKILQATTLRVAGFVHTADSTLRWIAEKGIGALIGELAKIALRHILDWLT